MKHYFTDNTDLKSEQSQFIFRFHKYDLLFTSDNGVFSKNMIDYGSRVLLDNIEITNEKTLLDVCTLAKQNGISKKELMTTLEIIFEEM